MVAVDVFAHFLNSVFEEVLDEGIMFFHFDDFDEFLHRSGAMSIFAELHWLLPHGFDDGSQLIFAAVISHLLDKVVAEAIIHEIPAVVDRAGKDMVE